MKHCHQCNLDFPGSYRFCGSCGGSLHDSLRCQGCGELVESKWTHCVYCGIQLLSDSIGAEIFLPELAKPAGIRAPSVLPSSTASSSQTNSTHQFDQQSKNVSFQEWYAAPDLFDEDSEITSTPIPRPDLMPKTAIAPPRLTARPQAGNGKTAPTLAMLSAYGGPDTTAPLGWRWRHGLLVGLLLLVFFVLGFGGWNWLTHRAASVAETPSQADSTIASGAASSSLSSSSSKPATTSAPIAARSGADDEWKRLREKRIEAKPSEASEIITSLEETEKKYARDYRFPYERAKLSIKGITTHHEAFGALSSAGEKAIDNGTAREMLDSLLADKDGDFYKLSRGHREWQALVQALSNKDKQALNDLHH